MAPWLLTLSIALSGGRNILSKKLSDMGFGTKGFFLCQGVLFFGGALALALFGNLSIIGISPEILIYAAVYGVLLILAQWFYTKALFGGNTALCSTVYSMGFILPTLSGAIFWSEELFFFDILGIISAIAAIIVSGVAKRGDGKKSSLNYVFPLIIAMLASGGLGIVQKLQQSSPCADQKGIFLVVSFLLAALISFVAAIFGKRSEKRICASRFAIAACVGVFFGCCNLLNTTLAGMLKSAIFFPTLNIGVILLSMLLGVIFYKERLRAKEISVLILGGISIILLNI